jgi:SOUL heme-binding protein
MTTPVLIRVDENGGAPVYSMMFGVADTYQVDARDAAAGLSTLRLPDMQTRITTFGGYASESVCRQRLRELIACTNNHTPATWFVAVYNSPFRVWGRKNEVFFFDGGASMRPRRPDL